MVERRGAVVYALLSRESFEKTSREMCVCIYREGERERGMEESFETVDV